VTILKVQKDQLMYFGPLYRLHHCTHTNTRTHNSTHTQHAHGYHSQCEIFRFRSPHHVIRVVLARRHSFPGQSSTLLPLHSSTAPNAINSRIIITCNKMQSETADFAPVPPSGELDQTKFLTSDCRHLANWTKRLGFDSRPFTPLCENMTSSTKPEVHNVLHCRQRSTDYRAAATGNIYRKFCRNLDVWFVR